MSWEDLERWAGDYAATDIAETRRDGRTNAQATTRLFGSGDGEETRVVLYRDNHAWCPYCQKVWLWLEERRVPYTIKKVTMFCYGDKEAWYKRIVPSGMLPAVSIDGRLVTESDVILHELDAAFGPLVHPIASPEALPMRRLERKLFSAWCSWLCRRQPDMKADERAGAAFARVLSEVDQALSMTAGPWFMEDFSLVDVVFVPYLERMNASLFYFKGFTVCDPGRFPAVTAWFAAMDGREAYRGTKSDFHTHSHDLPPQMGGCYPSGTEAQRAAAAAIDTGEGAGALEATYAEPSDSRQEAVWRVLRHRQGVIHKARATMTHEDAELALRCALTHLTRDTPDVTPALTALLPRGSDVVLRRVRDGISVPRDMSVHAARRLRRALEQTAAAAGDGQPEALPTRHRRDTLRAPFVKAA